MSIFEVLFILASYLAYLSVGCVVLYLIDEQLGEWVYNASNNFLFVITWTFWPFVIIAYYVKSRRD